jgi:hypothetical protein
MAAKKVKHRAKKSASNKNPHAPKAAARRNKNAGTGTGDSIVDAARRVWLSAEGSAALRVVSLPGSVRRLGTRLSR